MVQRILLSSAVLIAGVAVLVGGTGAFFSATTASTGNVFTAGAINLKVDHAAASYNGESCTINCNATGTNLILNGSFEQPVVTANSGNWQLFSSIPNWTLEAGSVIELQRNFALSADGEQHIELDGDGDEPATTISQTIATIPGERYRLSFALSPRPQSQAAGSGVRLEVEVVSPSNTIFSDTITTGSGPVNWSTYTYEFTAADPTTIIRFAYDGTVNKHGGWLDDVRVFQLECAGGYQETLGGFCELWDAKVLEDERFFIFEDVKPQDSGTNLISMHIESNEAYLCLNVANKENLENDLTAPEIAAGDTTPDEGELGQFLMVAGWYSDELGNKTSLLFGPTAANDLGVITYADSVTGPAPVQPGVTQYVHLEWCLGELTLNGNTASCDGNVPNINQAQTDAFLADLQFFAIQSRNNGQFVCADAFPSESTNQDNTDED